MGTQEAVIQETVTWEPPKKIWNPMFISIFLANAGLQMGQQMSNSLLSLYAKSMDAPADQIGQLMSMFAITALIFRFISGPAMNAYNRKKLVAMGMGFMAVAYLGFSWAPSLSEMLGVEAITILKCFRLFQGIGNAFGSACCLTIVADTLPKEQFTTGMGYYGLAQVIAQAIGPTVGVFLRDLFGYRVTYVIFFFVMCVGIFAATRVKLAPRKRIPFNLKLSNMIAKEALVPSIVTLLIAMGFTSINSFLLVYAEERGIVGGSLFFTVYAVTMLVTRPLVGKLTDRFGFVKVCVPAILMTACSLLLIGMSTNLFMLLVAAFVNAFGYGAVQPMLQALAMKSVPSERRGSASSTNSICMDIATIIGPTVCGWVASVFGYTQVMWAVMTIPVLAGALFVLLSRKSIAKIESAFEG
jgi:MFS family permease